jgi:DNA polymerase-3 subunit alpha
MESFVHLHVHTEYSMLDGLSRIPAIVSRAKQLGMKSLAITDHGGLYGAVQFYSECIKAGIKPILGCEVYVAPGSRHSKEAADRTPYHLILLAKNNTGYRNLIQLVSKSHLEGFYYKPRVDKELLEQLGEGIIALSGCPSAEVPQLIRQNRLDDAKEAVLWHNKVFDGYYLEIQAHNHVPELEQINNGVIALSNELGVPLVLTNDSHYTNREDAPIQDLLICIHTNTNVNDANRLRMEDDSFYLRSSEEMAALFPELTEAYENTRVIAEQCNVEIDFSSLHLPQYVPSDGSTAEEFLQKLCWDGLNKRIPDADDSYKERLRYELDVINKTQFPNYFLVVWDIAKFAREQNIILGVRGSAAASLVLYVTGVTDIDPLLYRLVFERFLNLERKEMPDIDMDFQDDRRDEVLQYVKNKYGHDHVAQIITFGTMGPKAAIRDTGRALGMSYGDVDRVARLVPVRVNSLAEAVDVVPELKEAYERDQTLRHLIESAKELEGVVRHSSTHAAGVVISEEPLAEYVPLQRPVKGNAEDIAMTQFSMEYIAKMGLLKMDFLGLANLSTLDRTIKIIKDSAGVEIELNKVSFDNEATFELLSSGETTGVFQLEGSGMRHYIKELKPSSLLDVAAMIALYRPGPMEHIDSFIQAKNGQKTPEYLHPILKDILEETYGVIVYQDQVLLIVQAMAGYSLGEADIVRKAMGKKIPAIMEEERDKFIKGALNQGYDQNLAEKMFLLIEPFAGYAFNKAHSVSYAVIAYWTAYFKANYPVEYMTALLNSHIGQHERISVDVDECTRLDIKVLAPNVNRSDVGFSIEENYENQKTIRFGLDAVKHVGTGAMIALINSRLEHGVFQSLSDFCRYADLSAVNRRSLEGLIKVGSLDEFGSRADLLATVERIMNVSQQEKSRRESGQIDMFDLFGEAAQAPLNEIELVLGDAVTKREIAEWERELLGKRISYNPLTEIAFAAKTTATAVKSDLEGKSDNSTVELVGQLAHVTHRASRDGRPYLIAVLEMLGGNLEVFVWDRIYEETKDVWIEGSLITVEGKIRNNDGQMSIRAVKAGIFDPDRDVSSQMNVDNDAMTGLIADATPANLEAVTEIITSLAEANGHGRVNKPPDPDANVPRDVPSNGEASGDNSTNGAKLVGVSKKVVINVKDTGDFSEDTYLLKSAIELLLGYKGNDVVFVDIDLTDQVVRLQMPKVTTNFCPELEAKLNALLGEGQIRCG